ncbi:MAG: chorismate-binding protein [Planctomycetota bacterium]|nr:chorismate-binding protein [Planctomycetota bacterium]
MSINCRSVPLRVVSVSAFADHLSPVLAYRRLVEPDARTAPSMLLESVEQGGIVGRWSIVAAQPAITVSAHASRLTITDHRTQTTRAEEHADPLAVPRAMTSHYEIAAEGTIPDTFIGGWGGSVGFDAVRWLEPGALPFQSAPHCDRGIADMTLSQYRSVVVFDHVHKALHAIAAVPSDESASEASAQKSARDEAHALLERLCHGKAALAPGLFSLDVKQSPSRLDAPTMSDAQFCDRVEKCQEWIRAGDAFQIVLSRRFERWSHVDPFDVYRALRVVNPSPYQVYMQTGDCMLVASSPEILCRTRGRSVVNRPLAGTRPRGSTCTADDELAHGLLADEKERAEHAMLVDLGRNDLARVAARASVSIDRCMEIERYSHVMHLSSTLSATLAPGLDAWDALRATLPVGTVSGAPKVRAIQIIDSLEPVRRGPYAGGIGVVGWGGDMDMAIALRTMVIPTRMRSADGGWRYDLQAGAGVVLDSVPKREADETRQKAAALGRALELAEHAWQ